MASKRNNKRMAATAPKQEVKTPVVEIKAAPVAPKAAEVKTEIKAEVKDAPKTEVITPVKEAPKAPAKAPKTAKPAAKAPAKTVAKTPAKKTAEKKPAVKRAPKAPVVKELDIVTLTTMLRKKIGKKSVAKIGENIAVEIKVYGKFEAFMYILVKDGALSIEPYNYDDCDVHVDISVDDVLAIIDGKYDFKAKALTGDIYAVGAMTKALKIKEVLFK